MDKKKLLIILAAVGFIVLVGVFIYTNQKTTGGDYIESSPTGKTTPSTLSDSNGTPSTTPSDVVTYPDRTNADFSNTIIAKNPSLSDTTTKQPVFTVTKTTQPLVHWYVVTLHNDIVSTSDAKVVLQDTGTSGGLVIKAGPGTGLDISNPTLPEEVKQELKNG